jgi:hypothetical protein
MTSTEFLRVITYAQDDPRFAEATGVVIILLRETPDAIGTRTHAFINTSRTDEIIEAAQDALLDLIDPCIIKPEAVN